jgi:hypothetical protein
MMVMMMMMMSPITATVQSESHGVRSVSKVRTAVSSSSPDMDMWPCFYSLMYSCANVDFGLGLSPNEEILLIAKELFQTSLFILGRRKA